MRVVPEVEDRVVGRDGVSPDVSRSEAGREDVVFAAEVSGREDVSSMSMLSVETREGSRLEMEAAMSSTKVTLVVVVTRLVLGM